MAWVDKEWIAAWGENKPLIATDYDDALPVPPEGYIWRVTRHLFDDGKGGFNPNVEVALHDNETCGYIDHGRIDKKIYGDGAAVIQLAQDILKRNSLPSANQQPDPEPPRERGLYQDLTIRDRSRSKAQSRVIGGISSSTQHSPGYGTVTPFDEPVTYDSAGSDTSFDGATTDAGSDYDSSGSSTDYSSSGSDDDYASVSSSSSSSSSDSGLGK